MKQKASSARLKQRQVPKMRDLAEAIRPSTDEEAEKTGSTNKNSGFAGIELLSWKVCKHLVFLVLLFGCHLLVECDPQTMTKVTEQPGYFSSHTVTYDGPDASSVFQDLEKAGYSRVNGGQQSSRFGSFLSSTRNQRPNSIKIPGRQLFGSESPPKYGRQPSSWSLNDPFSSMNNFRKQAQKRFETMRKSMLKSMPRFGTGFGGMSRKPTQTTRNGSDNGNRGWTKPDSQGYLGGNTGGRNGSQKEGANGSPNGRERDSPKLGGRPPLGGNNEVSWPPLGGNNGVSWPPFGGNKADVQPPAWAPMGGNKQADAQAPAWPPMGGNDAGSWLPVGGNTASTQGRNGGWAGGADRYGYDDIQQENTNEVNAMNAIRKKYNIPPIELNDQVVVGSPGRNGRQKTVYGNFYQDCLDAHNEYRKRHRVAPLRLNQEMSEISQRWAEHLAGRGSVMGIYHSDLKFRNGWGENIHASLAFKETGRLAVDSWYAEIDNYDFKTGKSTNGKSIGHLTAMLWDTSKELGVGYAFGSDGSIFVVCHYNPRGNYESIFHQHVPPVGGFTQADKRRFNEENKRRGPLRWGQPNQDFSFGE